ncbi:class I SAM-dependent methyltransferase [Olivibacter sp. CPCC 100613]|uniref:class I SAM-dependent methyltransferase n=1 Tax=Olivibacter sp. CPCC 100613 TaxID=3079931 RepID=UPI002FF4FEDC
MKENKPDFEKIAAQLACPSGEMGVEVGNRMNESNGEMTRHAIDLLGIVDGEKVVELGPGNARFASYVLDKGRHIHYLGADISEVMIEEARQINRAFLEGGSVSLFLLKRLQLPFEDESIDKAFTVNTLYFWQEPLSVLAELYRVLKPGGLLCLAIRSKAFMQSLPFTAYGFTLYSPEEGMTLCERTAFSEKSYTIISSLGETFTGDPVTKEDVFFVLKKDT